MTVHYYGIVNCDFNYLDGAPVIIAPPDTAPALLAQYAFEQDAEGRWFHALTVDEMRYLDSGADPAVFGKPPRSYTVSPLLILLSRLCVYLAVAISAALIFGGVSHGITLLTFAGLMTAGLIASIIACVRYPSHKAKTALRRYLTLHILAALGILFAADFCHSCCTSTRGVFSSCKGCTAEPSESSDVDSLTDPETPQTPDAEHSGS